jgi:hypothetical protein
LATTKNVEEIKTSGIVNKRIFGLFRSIRCDLWQAKVPKIKNRFPSTPCIHLCPFYEKSK